MTLIGKQREVTLTTVAGKPVVMKRNDIPTHPDWYQNPDNPSEHVRRYGALFFSVKQDLDVPTMMVANLADGRTIGLPFRTGAEAFAFADLVLDAVDYEEAEPEVPENLTVVRPEKP